MRKFNPDWDRKFAEWVASDPKIVIDTPEGQKTHRPKQSMMRFNAMDLPLLKTKQQKDSYRRIMLLRMEAEEKEFQKFIDESGLRELYNKIEADALNDGENR